MTGGFDANVPVRKPRTKIARVISELTAAPPGGLESAGESAALEDIVPAAREAAGARNFGGPGPAAGARGHGGFGAAADAGPARPATVVLKKASIVQSPVPGGREQIAKLRERLAATAHARTGAAEPKQTAAAVREMVDGLRDRIEASTRERSELATALEQARVALAQSSADLERERRVRAGLEAQAEERRRIADDAVAEAEALAAERDQVLGELTEHRRLEGDQTSLLTEIEAALAERDAERESAAREIAEARSLANLRAAEVVELEIRLQGETGGRARAEARCRELEAEIARLSEARQALESIEAVLYRRRGDQGDGG